jgi:hypothetical protein
LTWETAENEEEEPEETESDEESEEGYETDEGSTTSSLAALQERFGRTEEVEWKPSKIESGKYLLKAIIGHNGDGLWAVLKRDGMWVGRNGLVTRPEGDARLEGVRLEFWDRL